MRLYADVRCGSQEEIPEADLAQRLVAAFPALQSDAVRIHLALGRAFYRGVRALEGYVLPDGTIFCRAKSNFLALLYMAEDHQLTVGALAQEVGLGQASATRILDSLKRTVSWCEYRARQTAALPTHGSRSRD